MPILAITPETRTAAETVRAHAEDPANWVTPAKLSDTVYSPGDDPKLCLKIPVNYRVVYSVEQTEPPDGPALRHMSVSLAGTTKKGAHQGVHRAAMQEIKELFGFTNKAQVGRLPFDPPWVVHAIEPLDTP